MKNASADFLLEIGCEEIPARMIPRAAEELKQILTKYLAAHELLLNAPVIAYGAPRRLVVECANVRVQQADVVKDVTGPPKSVAFDNVGKPTRAAESFAEKQGIPLSKIQIVQTPKGEYLAARQVIKGRAARAILAEILPRAIQEIPWPRSMYWTAAAGPRFIRPIRWIVAVLGGEIIPFELGGVRSGNRSQGHRFLGKANPTIKGTRDYRTQLAKQFVLADPHARRQKIEKELHAAVSRRGLHPHADEDLLNQVTYLNEFPSVIIGDFSESFLSLPDEILITVMRDHQKYFAVNHKDGRLAPHFLAVINLARDRSGQVRAGHEKVLRARFADARFFWESDQKCRLADMLPRLKHVTFESKLGSYGDKVERVRWLARWLAEQWFSAGIHQADVTACDRAAELCKCDLTAEMVREFTELQGIVGGLYAKAQGEPEEVAWAVYDHYRPVGIDDPIPRNLTGCIVAMADKLDTLSGCLAVGKIPTGSSDPFALRRAAIGVVKILLERKLPHSLSATIAACTRMLGQLPPRIMVGPEVEKQLMDFLLERVRFVFRERHGFAFDEINAALAAGQDDLVDAEKRLAALKAVRKTKNFEPLAVSFKRIRKILEKAGPQEGWRLPSVSSEFLTEEAERELHQSARRVAGEAATLKRAGQYREALTAISALRPQVDKFFEQVLVMAEDSNVRKNRLTLLAELLSEFSTIADFSEIVTAEHGK
ncbi:MAG: glycine--tRNA ligase subunit beta [Acidobacteria bacterium]|nr:glycine--tRNA ligase subunit beta [Acidobacteriota bacterium]